MTLSPKASPGQRIRAASRTLFQVGLIIAIWQAAVWLCQHWLKGMPPAIAGLAMVLLLLSLGLLRREWLSSGANLLLHEMLLFFIPVVVAIMNYSELIRTRGFVIVVIVLVSTTCVMISTALAVDLVWRLEHRWCGRKAAGQ